MLEAPEALCLSEQLTRTLKGKRITEAIAGYTPHKFTWFYGRPETYPDLLSGKTIGVSRAYGGMVEIEIGEMRLLFSDGANLRYLAPGAPLPKKHQLLLGFEDDSCLTVSVRMYGGICCLPPETPGWSLQSYYDSAKQKPQVMSDAFDLAYFLRLIRGEGVREKSAKAFLATGQTIPGLGNGVLQDILYKARIHPKTRIGTLTDAEYETLFPALKDTLNEIYRKNGRRTETDLFGRQEGYVPFLGNDTVGAPCPRCGEILCKDAYLGGSIYYCPGCQPVPEMKKRIPDSD